MATKLARMVIYLDRQGNIKLWLRGLEKLHNKQKPLYLHCKSVYGKQIGRIMTSLEGSLPVMSHDPFIMWPCEIRGSLTWGGSARKPLKSSPTSCFLCNSFVEFTQELVACSCDHAFKPMLLYDFILSRRKTKEKKTDFKKEMIMNCSQLKKVVDKCIVWSKN